MIFFKENDTNQNPLKQGSLLSVPSAMAITLLTIISQVFNLHFSTEPIIKLLGKSIFPLISAGVAYSLGGIQSLICGLLGGILSASGISITSLNSNIQGVSGLYGCLIAGRIAGKSFLLIRKILLAKTNSDSYPFGITISALSSGITLICALILNEISVHINSLTTLILTTMSSLSPLLTCVISGILISTGSMGPFYLSSYLFATAALSTEQGQILISTAAGASVSYLSIVVFCLLYSQGISHTEKLCAFTGFLGGLFGTSYSSLPLIAANPIKMAVSFIPGGCVASLLCALFGCNTSTTPAGLITLFTYEKPLYYILGTACGVLVSVFIMSLLFETKEESDSTEAESVALARETPA